MTTGLEIVQGIGALVDPYQRHLTPHHTPREWPGHLNLMGPTMSIFWRESWTRKQAGDLIGFVASLHHERGGAICVGKG